MERRPYLSLEVVTHARAADAARALRAARRRPGCVAATYTFAGSALHAPWAERRGVVPGRLLRGDGWGSVVDWRRVMLLSAWPSAHARDAGAPARRPPGAVEHWHAELRCVRSTGAMWGEDPLGGIAASAGTGAQPGVVFTYAGVPPRLIWEFARLLFGSVEEQHRSAGALASFATPGFRRMQFSGFTVSAWRRLDDALAFVRAPEHAAAMRWFARQEVAGAGIQSWFARCVVEGSQGTLAGRDPFAAEDPPAMSSYGARRACSVPSTPI